MAFNPMLVTEKLTKTYGNLVALDQFDLMVEPGKILGILGPNGAGKSTALRLIMGFLRPTSGRSSIAGFDSWHQSVAVRQRVAYLPGELRLYENMTGRQLLEFLGSLRQSRPNARGDRLARQLDIDLDRPLTQLSSGMKRKVALLLVLVPDVPLIILDEPTNTLDPTMRDALLDQLKEAGNRGQTVVFSSHVLSEVETICDDVAILKQGRLMLIQPMDTLREGRRVEARLSQAPSDTLMGLTWESFRDDGLYIGTYHGPLELLLAWLSTHAVTDLRLEPLGMGPLYHRFHPAAEVAL